MMISLFLLNVCHSSYSADGTFSLLHRQLQLKGPAIPLAAAAPSISSLVFSPAVEASVTKLTDSISGASTSVLGLETSLSDFFLSMSDPKTSIGSVMSEVSTSLHSANYPKSGGLGLIDEVTNTVSNFHSPAAVANYSAALFGAAGGSLSGSVLLAVSLYKIGKALVESRMANGAIANSEEQFKNWIKFSRVAQKNQCWVKRRLYRKVWNFYRARVSLIMGAVSYSAQQMRRPAPQLRIPEAILVSKLKHSFKRECRWKLS
jgi:hypothetical protein